jgi:hypothetical protein
MARLYRWGAITLCMSLCLFGTPPNRLSAQWPLDRSDLVRALDDVGAALSTLLGNARDRDFVIGRLVDAPAVDAVPLRDILWELGSPTAYGLMGAVDRAEGVMAHLGHEPPRVDVFLLSAMLSDDPSVEPPEPGSAIFVAVAPLTEGDDPTELQAFDAGQAITQPAARPPDIPTIVVGAAESTILDPGYPPIVVDGPTTQETDPIEAGGFVGIPYLTILDDHEPWWRGRPETYVVIQRFLLGGVPKDTRVELTGVDEAGAWYSLRDPNGSYAYVDQHHLPSIHVHVWEDDGSLDPPDYLGFFGIHWDDLPTDGYVEAERFFGSDASLYVDRD